MDENGIIPIHPHDFGSFPLRTLNPTTKRILTLLATGNHTQSQTARIVGVSRQYVVQVVKKFLALGLLKLSPHTGANTNKRFEASSSLKYVLESGALENLCSCRVPHVRVKYCYITDAPLAFDNTSPSRSFYIKSWNMIGGPRHKFMVPGTIDIVIDDHPGCIIALLCLRPEHSCRNHRRWRPQSQGRHSRRCTPMGQKTRSLRAAHHSQRPHTFMQLCSPSMTADMKPESDLSSGCDNHA